MKKWMVELCGNIFSDRNSSYVLNSGKDIVVTYEYDE